MHSSPQLKNDNFAADVFAGLSDAPKFLSSKYFYDAEGSRLFQRIMDLPEYYLTRAEFEIFERQTAEICEAFARRNRAFDLIELGAGDGTKTAVLIDYFLRQNLEFAYAPIDISREAVDALTEKFKNKFPALSVNARIGDYLQTLDSLKNDAARPKILLFLGSNIGNFARAQSVEFFKRLRCAMNANDLLFVGFDLQKDPRTILAAYDDAQGVTAEFNLNLLRRINRELGADFSVENFSHYATYHPFDGAARSFLISGGDQTVFVKALNQSFHFKAFEPIFMEISQKYRLAMIEDLARECGFQIEQNFFDHRRYFADSLWRISNSES